MNKKNEFGWDFLISPKTKSFFGDDSDWSSQYSDGSGTYESADGSYGHLYSDGSGSYEGADGSYGYLYSDGSGSYEGADGSRGYMYSDGSGSYEGANGSHGYIYSDGTGSFTDQYGNTTYFDKDSISNNNYWAKLGSQVGKSIGDFIVNAQESSTETVRNKSNNKKYKRKKKKDDSGFKTAMIAIGLVFFVFGIIAIILLIQPEEVGEDEIKMTSSASDYSGENYEVVKKTLEDSGFYNIECIALEDLTTGWLKKENSVDKVSIAGNFNFSRGDIFKKDANIVITYHSFKKKK